MIKIPHTLTKVNIYTSNGYSSLFTKTSLNQHSGKSGLIFLHRGLTVEEAWADRFKK